VLFVVSQLSLAAFAWRYGDRPDGGRSRRFPEGPRPWW